MLHFDSIADAEAYAQVLIDQAELEQTLAVTQIALVLAAININQ